MNAEARKARRMFHPSEVEQASACARRRARGSWFLKSKQDIFFEVVQLVQGDVVVVVVGKEYLQICTTHKRR